MEQQLFAAAQLSFQALSQHEADLLRCIEAGLDYNSSLEEPARRTQISASLLRWLCTSNVARSQITGRGIRVFDAEIHGLLDLQYIDCPFPLVFERCSFSDKVDLSFARLPQLRIFECTLTRLESPQIRITESMILSKSVFSGPVHLQSSRIGGNLRFFDSQVLAGTDVAINLEGTQIDGALQFTGHRFRAHGSLRLFGLSVRRNIECSGTIYVTRGDAITLEQATISGAVLLRSGFRALGRVRVFETTVAGTLDLQGARLSARDEPALLIAGSTIGRSILLHEDRHYKPGTALRSVRGIAIRRSVVGENIDVRGAVIRSRRHVALNILDTTVRGRIIANRLDARGRVSLNRTVVANDVELNDARVACDTGHAIHGIGLECRGAFFMEKAEIAGPISLQHIIVANDLVARGLVVTNNKSGGFLALQNGKFGTGISLQDARIVGRLIAPNLTSNATVNLSGTRTAGIELHYSKIGLDLLLGGAALTALAREPALSLDFADVKGSIVADSRFSAKGSIKLNSCSVSGSVYLRDPALDGGGGPVIIAPFARIGNNMVLAGGTAKGPIVLGKSVIEGALDLSGLAIDANGHATVSAIGATMRGGLRLGNGFTANGRVEFDRANVVGDVFFGDCSISGPDDAVSLEAATIQGDLQIGFTVTIEREESGAIFNGTVNLMRATISGEADLSCATFNRGTANNSAQEVLRLNRTRIDGSLLLIDDFTANGIVDLRDAKVTAIHDTRDRWPAEDAMRLDGLTYEALRPLDTDERLVWLSRQRSALQAVSSWQPYEQLAKALRQQGLDRHARKVMIAKERAITDSTTSRRRRYALRLFGLAMGYGYEPQRALIAAPLLIVMMAIVFLTGANGLMVPVNDVARKEFVAGKPLPEGYPPFNSIVYPIDVLVPVVSLQQKEFWRPNAAQRCTSGPKECGAWLRFALWFYVAAGWLITTLAVAGFTGLIRRT